MALPGFTADASLSASGPFSMEGTTFEDTADGQAILPQVCVGSPCLSLPSGRFCVNLPIFGRKCVNIPSLGRWQVRCCTRFSFPPFSCGVKRCN